MPPKRKSPPGEIPSDVEEIFRRHFEAQFAPIDDTGGADDCVGVESDEKAADSDVADSDVADEWGGLSDDDRDRRSDISGDEEDNSELDSESEDEPVQVVDHSSTVKSAETMSKRDLRKFMTEPDTDTTRTTQASAKPAKTLPEDAPTLLAQDLELRRLLSESHLLNPTAISSASTSASTSRSSDGPPRPFMSGRIRQKATDLRIQALGSKLSILTQESMPMSIRKGIVASGAAKEAKRRREARENGIILERPSNSSSGPNGSSIHNKRRRGAGGGGGGNRDVDVHRPGMGRFRGAELRLDENAVKSIENSRDAFGRGGRGGRGKRRR
ncbi:Conserved hypothetical, protein [Geosmithia morbida]|uniref:Conserved hypothetical, protein n=1 Tax=Geosmithia morbida TaxID=1094350 RepID=A0A9P4YTC6_9HYPO|nr:Conserved hypothetical, protein [Geosmithia morbida]KAF4121301.1 Conserved hypothetical, protein [Geosmithia morbida]